MEPFIFFPRFFLSSFFFFFLRTKYHACVYCHALFSDLRHLCWCVYCIQIRASATKLCATQPDLPKKSKPDPLHSQI
ncbi:hypothetical protein GLYMA_16G000900v4 [Glycine max]|uniref:Secreted protein n=1 Tax=Glycine max TaxID=3847 RepID=K7MEB4_SOYBN|nr:hypothetical protein GYH30_043682 [Glycine max]KRH06033.1 hypothetical protein GLYMA_16G000900v4 [Glycine max]